MSEEAKRRSIIVRIAAVCSSILTVYAISTAIGAGIMEILTGGGCKTPSAVAGVAGLLNPLVLLFSLPFQLWEISHASARRLAWAVGPALAFWLVHFALDVADDREQRACARRSFPEAARACGADPTWYRLGDVKRIEPGDDGYRVATLVTADHDEAGEMCLIRWSRAHRRVAMKIDIEVDPDVRRQQQLNYDRRSLPPR